jgi:hypothetical protein
MPADSGYFAKGRELMDTESCHHALLREGITALVNADFGGIMRANKQVLIGQFAAPGI